MQGTVLSVEVDAGEPDADATEDVPARAAQAPAAHAVPTMDDQPYPGYEVLRANILPDVQLVPGMVVAVEQAQRAGLSYHRQ